MITKERLEELIEQGATIYAITKNPFIIGYSQILKVEEFDLKAPIVKEINEDGKQFLYYNYLLDLEYLFETEEDAHWELEMTAIRTETLKMPKWEERDTFFEFRDKDGNNIDLTICYGNILVQYYNTNNIFIKECFNKPLTKENYIEACKLCLRLFKGE